jgi:membrane-bound inhibitor of C-type lysozyme
VRHYECATGVSITVTFLPDPPGAQIEQEGFPTITLQQAPSGAGFRYRRGSVEFRGNDQEGRLSRAGGGELRCLVTGTPS